MAAAGKTGAMETLRTKRRSNWVTWALLVLVCAAGVCNAFGPTLGSGFRRMQADAIDTRFNGYILEYGFRWISGRAFGSSFWSPPFYFPAQGVLAYSDNLLGSAPLYWVLRTVCDRDVAYMLWMILCAVLCFASFVAVARRAGVRNSLSAAGGFIFAFGFWRCRLINHQQLLPQFLTPVVVWLLWKWIEAPTLARWAWLGALLYLQALCGIYLGWFLGLSLLPFAVIAVLLGGRDSKGALRFVRRRWVACGAVALGFGLLGVATFWPYLHLRQSGATFGWAEVNASLLRAADWLPPWRAVDAKQVAVSAAAGDFSASVRPALPCGGWIFLATLIVGCVAMAVAVGRGPEQSRHCARLGLSCALAGLALILLATRFGDEGFSAWRWMYQLMPGAAAIRAVDRVALLVQFYFALALVLGIESLLALRAGRWVSWIGIFLCVILIAEQWVTGLPSFEVAPLRHQAAELTALMRSSGGDVAYVADYGAPSGFDYAVMQLTAMDAGLDAGVPVVNGYSAMAPAGYRGSGRPILPWEMGPWLSDAAGGARRLVLIAPAPPGIPVDWGQQFHVVGAARARNFEAQTLMVHSDSTRSVR